MESDTAKPNVIIFGGLNTYSRPLVSLLVPVDGEPLVSYLRIVDKYSVFPPTTYIGPEFAKILQKPNVEYRQANLTVESAVSSSFEPPTGQAPYDYVFDFSGEIRSDRTEMVQIKATCNVARLIGLEASRRKVKAYVRLQHPFYDTSEKASANEKVDIKPAGTLGIWWHETLRVLGAIEDLNLVIVRVGFGYGPYIDYGIVTTAITVGSVYGHMKKPMRSIWSPGKNPTNTVHVYDIAGCMWTCAEWMAALGRGEANTVAGEEIPFHNDKGKASEVPGVPAHDRKIIAPLFNLVDDANSTLISCGQVITSFFSTTFEFFNFLTSKMAQFNLEDAVEDINEHHVSAWTEMITTSNPPIPNTPLSAYMDTYALSKHVVSLDNEKVKRVLGYKLRKPDFNHENIKEIVDAWKAEGTWPTLDQ